MRKSEKVKRNTIDTLRTRKDNIIDKQIVDISIRLDMVKLSSNYDMRLDELESIYRNLGIALKIINAIKINIFEERIK